MSSGSRSRWSLAWVALAVAFGLGGCDLFYPHDYSCPTGDCPFEPWDGGGLAPDGGLFGDLNPGSDLGDPDAGTALRVINWNILWFGNTASGFGPSDEAQQFRNVSAVMKALRPDVFGLQEISDDALLAELVAQLPGYAGFSAINPSVTNASLYWDQQPRTAFVYRTEVVQVLGASIVPVSNRYAFAYRPPLRVDARVTKAGVRVDVTILVVHLKASAGQSDWERRRDSALELKAWLDANLPDANVLVIGDFNDDLDSSIADSVHGVLPSPFVPFLEDEANYTFATRVLSEAQLGTTVNYGSTIDHQLASNEMAARLEPGSVRRIQPNLWPTPVPNYGRSTSDHYPIEARYQLNAP